MSNHTQGQLLVRGTRIRSTDAGIDCVASMQVSNQPQWDQDARRLVACWNAFDGVPTDVVEEVDGTETICRKYVEARKQRNELLAALRDCRAVMAANGLGGVYAAQLADAAISKATQPTGRKD